MNTCVYFLARRSAVALALGSVLTGVIAADFGQAGDLSKVARTIEVAMTDDMRFEPAHLSVARSETVRFVVRNDGRLLHEMVLGTQATHAGHAELMKNSPKMAHDDANSVHVQPGRSGDLVWRFTRSGEFQFACLQPGHFEAGMVGKVSVK